MTVLEFFEPIKVEIFSDPDEAFSFKVTVPKHGHTWFFYGDKDITINNESIDSDIEVKHNFEIKGKGRLAGSVNKIGFHIESTFYKDLKKNRSIIRMWNLDGPFKVEMVDKK